MPTAPRLFGAFGFALVAMFAANAIIPLMPDGTQFGFFVPVTTAIGALSGWGVMGRLAGKGYYAALGSGVRTSITLVFFGLCVFSITQMLTNSIAGRYDGPATAMTGTFEIAAEYAITMADPQVIGILLIGGFLAAALSEWASHRWP